MQYCIHFFAYCVQCLGIDTGRHIDNDRMRHLAIRQWIMIAQLVGKNIKSRIRWILALLSRQNAGLQCRLVSSQGK